MRGTNKYILFWMITGGGKRAVFVALAAATTLFLFAEVAVAHKAMSDDDDLVAAVNDGAASVNSESGGEATGEAGLGGQENDLEANVKAMTG